VPSRKVAYFFARFQIYLVEHFSHAILSAVSGSHF